MSRRGYLDLTPTELLGRRYAAWGLGLSVLPPLLTSCHTVDYLCQSHWDGNLSPITSLWALSPWTLPIALVMAGGLGMALVGAVLLVRGRHFVSADPLQSAAFGICAVSLLAILAVGGLGYFVCDAISPGFAYSPDGWVMTAWLLPQAVLIAVYLGGAALAVSTALRSPAHAVETA